MGQPADESKRDAIMRQDGTDGMEGVETDIKYLIAKYIEYTKKWYNIGIKSV